jgi:Transmembrane secretion effector
VRRGDRVTGGRLEPVQEQGDRVGLHLDPAKGGAHGHPQEHLPVRPPRPDRGLATASDPSRILEQFVVASWDEHLRQHERVTKRDQGRLDRIREPTDPAHPVAVTQ